jgi:hypothetical protein
MGDISPGLDNAPNTEIVAQAVSDEHLLLETQAACMTLLIHHISCSHSTMSSGYLTTLLILWEFGHQRLIRRQCVTCYLLCHWLLRAEGQEIDSVP